MTKMAIMTIYGEKKDSSSQWFMNGYILNLPKAKIARLAKLLETMYKKLPEIMLKLQWLRNYLK